MEWGELETTQPLSAPLVKGVLGWSPFDRTQPSTSSLKPYKKYKNQYYFLSISKKKSHQKRTKLNPMQTQIRE